MDLWDELMTSVLLVKQPTWLSRMFNKPYEIGWSGDNDNRQNAGLAPREEGVHSDSSLFYFEWWYCDARFEQGYTMTVSLHLVDPVRPGAQEGQLNLHIAFPDGTSRQVIRQIPRSSLRAATEGCDVQVGSARLSGCAPLYKLSVEESDLAVDLTFTSELPGWKPGNGRIRFGRKQNRHFSYVVPQPRARVEGVLKIDGHKTTVLGTGYHEHAWGNIPLIGAVPRWYWGRLYSEKHSIIYADLVLGSQFGSKHVTPVMVARKGKILGDTIHATLQLDDFCSIPGYPCPYPGTVYLDIQDSRFPGRLTLHTRQVIESANILSASHPLRRWIIKSLIAQPVYFRLLTDVNGEISFDGKPERVQCTTIQDMMLWRPE